MTELEALRVVELKGRVRVEDVATPLGVDTAQAQALLADLDRRGFLAPAGPAYKLSGEGRRHLADLLELDRRPVDQVLLGLAYDEFCGFNAELKTIITAWQMKDASTPNDHTDAAYDAAVLGQLASLHSQAEPLFARLAEIAPRLRRYAARFQYALDRIAAGDSAWVARPILDSYHTVWFELHEDLIQLSGRTRLEEAAAGRAH